MAFLRTVLAVSGVAAIHAAALTLSLRVPEPIEFDSTTVHVDLIDAPPPEPEIAPIPPSAPPPRRTVEPARAPTYSPRPASAAVSPRRVEFVNPDPVPPPAPEPQAVHGDGGAPLANEGTLPVGKGGAVEAKPLEKPANEFPKASDLPSAIHANGLTTAPAVGNFALASGAGTTFVPQGEPGYPGACKRGTHNFGLPCEGVSEWRITAGPDGKALKVEALSPMDCNLLTSAVKTFFQKTAYPATGSTVQYQYTMPMYVRR